MSLIEKEKSHRTALANTYLYSCHAKQIHTRRRSEFVSNRDDSASAGRAIGTDTDPSSLQSDGIWCEPLRVGVCPSSQDTRMHTCYE